MATNSSVLNPSVCVTDVTATTASKVSINIIQKGHGFTAGSAVRWNSGIDGHTAEYVAAKADNSYNAEVAGIVSKVIGESSFELTVAGVIKMNNFFDNVSGCIPAGITRDDVYFLSGETAGWLDSKRPTTPGFVAKPIITRLAEDAQGNIYGSVNNYVGSLLGGNVVVSLGNLVPVGTIQPFLGSESHIPSGWAICDGNGHNTVSQDVPGLPVDGYQEYYTVTGKRYGWVEVLKTDWANPSIGDRVEQIVQGRTISGLVVGLSGGADNDGRRYVYVKQSYENDVPFSVNGNFMEEINSGTQDGAEETTDILRGSGTEKYDRVTSSRNQLFEFEFSQKGESFNVTSSVSGSQRSYLNYQDVSEKNGVYSVLTPNLRSKLLMGAEEDDLSKGINESHVLGKKGGNAEMALKGSSVDEDGDSPYSGGDGGIGEGSSNTGWAIRQNILPPYLTINWIVRTDPNAYASLIDRLEIKNLKLSNLPTSGTGTEEFTVYRDALGNLKINT